VRFGTLFAFSITKPRVRDIAKYQLELYLAIRIGPFRGKAFTVKGPLQGVQVENFA
jgi:hypothetical protein